MQPMRCIYGSVESYMAIVRRSRINSAESLFVHLSFMPSFHSLILTFFFSVYPSFHVLLKWNGLCIFVFLNVRFFKACFKPCFCFHFYLCDIVSSVDLGLRVSIAQAYQQRPCERVQLHLSVISELKILQDWCIRKCSIVSFQGPVVQERINSSPLLDTDKKALNFAGLSCPNRAIKT